MQNYKIFNNNLNMQNICNKSKARCTYNVGTSL